MENKRFTAVSCDGAAITIRFSNTTCNTSNENKRNERIPDSNNPHKLAEWHRKVSAKWHSKNK